MRRDLGSAAGTVSCGLQHVTVAAGKLGCPPHVHSSEEEVFVVLEGDGVCLLGSEEHPIRAGSVVARPPGTGVAHAIRAGADGITYLAYGDRIADDMCYYPRSNKISFGFANLIGRLEKLDYWDGEGLRFEDHCPWCAGARAPMLTTRNRRGEEEAWGDCGTSEGSAFSSC